MWPPLSSRSFFLGKKCRSSPGAIISLLPSFMPYFLLAGCIFSSFYALFISRVIEKEEGEVFSGQKVLGGGVTKRPKPPHSYPIFGMKSKNAQWAGLLSHGGLSHAGCSETTVRERPLAPPGEIVFEPITQLLLLRRATPSPFFLLLIFVKCIRIQSLLG